MKIVFDIATTDQHFEQILQLQRQNLVSEISQEQQTQQGFVFAEHTMDLLKMMADQLPQVIAVNDGKVIGYNLAMPVSMKNAMPSLVPMFEEFGKIQYEGRLLTTYHFIVGGQVCVDKNFRGHGLLSKLYNATKDRLPSEYELCVTEVSTRNSRALKAHEQMGFKVVSTYHDGKELWNIVVWNLKRD